MEPPDGITTFIITRGAPASGAGCPLSRFALRGGAAGSGVPSGDDARDSFVFRIHGDPQRAGMGSGADWGARPTLLDGQAAVAAPTCRATSFGDEGGGAEFGAERGSERVLRRQPQVLRLRCDCCRISAQD